jgi:hypothetical protein
VALERADVGASEYGVECAGELAVPVTGTPLLADLADATTLTGVVTLRGEPAQAIAASRAATSRSASSGCDR